jgi:competence protein ComEA
MQQFFDDFHLTRKTRAGALALLIILILLILIWRMMPAVAQPKADKDEIALQAAWSEFQTKYIDTNADNTRRSYPGRETALPITRQAELFLFNPNTASEADLLRLGLPKYTVNTILKYRAKNSNAFKKKEDLKKLYTLKKEDYERIEPYIDIPQNTSAYIEDDKPVAVSKQPYIVELNGADAEQLMSLRGIGATYSKRIINFREVLGGFIKVEQLKEVYGFPDSTYQQLKDKFTVNSSLVRRININIADEYSLGRHPYIGKKIAGDIIKLRKENGLFNDLEQLKQVPLINEEKYRKIAPYLSTH